MRTIKFRAWDKEYEKMTYFDDEDYDYRPPLVFRLDQVFKKDSNYDDYEDFEYNDITDKVDIMQYTGLHDENGKEIYEGDIVEFKDVGEEGYEYKEGFDFDNIAQVVYENGIYTLSNFGETDNSHYATNCTDEERLEEVLRNGNCEVIGNIYENKELLNETDR